MATVKVIDIKNLTKELGVKFAKSNKKEVYEAVYDGLLKSVEPMAERSPVDTGLYANSWEVEKLDENTVTFGNTAPYAFTLEKGARPYTAPIQPLLEWAGRKLQLPEDHPEVKSFAWAVRKKFEREGMAPKNILEKGIDEVIMPNILKNLDKV